MNYLYEACQIDCCMSMYMYKINDCFFINDWYEFYHDWWGADMFKFETIHHIHVHIKDQSLVVIIFPASPLCTCFFSPSSILIVFEP